MYLFLLYHFFTLFIVDSHVMLILILTVLKPHLIRFAPQVQRIPKQNFPCLEGFPLPLLPSLTSHHSWNRGRVEFSEFSQKVGSSEFSHDKGRVGKIGGLF